jgi:hypothetical protein
MSPRGQVRAAVVLTACALVAAVGAAAAGATGATAAQVQRDRQLPPRDKPAEPTGTGVIAGVVITADERQQPVRRVSVLLASGQIVTPRTVVTDDAGRFEFTAVAPGSYTLVGQKPAWVPAVYGSHDADELHLGLEYAFLRHWPIVTLRAGAWHEPDHTLRFEGENVGFRAVFRPRGDQMHYTAGVGMALRRIQVDAAIDHSERVNVVSLSAGFRH